MRKSFGNLLYQRRTLLRIANLWLNESLYLVRVGLIIQLRLPHLSFDAKVGAHDGCPGASLANGVGWANE